MRLPMDLRWALSILLLAASLLAAAALAPSTSDAGEARKPPPSVSCAFAEESGVLTIRIRDQRVSFPRGFFEGLPRRFRDELRHLRDRREPGSARIERRGEDVTVLSAHERRSPVPCEGAVPTVSNTETIRVREGKQAKDASLLVDLTYGRFEPGATDEADGGSEIEFDVAVERRLSLRLTRGADPLTLEGGGPVNAINLNATEPVADDDLTVATQARIRIDGAGSADVINAGGASRAREARGLELRGGQGDDTLRSGGERDFLYPGSGRDRVDAGAGADFVVALESAPDRIDCGGGHDVVLIRRDARHRFHDCERKDTVRDYFGDFDARPRPGSLEASLHRKLRAG